MKKLLPIIIVALCTALLTGGLVIFATGGSGNDGEPGVVSSLFESKKSSEVHFVTIKDIVITLNSGTGNNNGSGYDHYLLLDLALTANSPDDVKAIEGALPLIQSSTVNMLTNLKYHEIRTTDVQELRQKLFNEYKAAFENLGMPIAFTDVLISKMLFQ